MPATLTYSFDALHNVVLSISEADGTGVVGGTNLDTAGYVPFVLTAGELSINKTAGKQLFWDNTNGRLGIGNAAPAFGLDVTGVIRASSTLVGASLNLGGGAIIISTALGITLPLSIAPAAANSTGTAGQIVADTGFIYVCTTTNTWKRVEIATWS